MDKKERTEQVLGVLRKLQRKVCCYDGLIHENPPPRCDCKYGGEGISKGLSEPYHGEGTGCPELREAIYIIEQRLGLEDVVTKIAGEKILKHEMGVQVKDVITGFIGTITGLARYITGCDQYLLAPRVDGGGNHVDGRWFDGNRLEPTGLKLSDHYASMLSGDESNGACEPASVK